MKDKFLLFLINKSLLLNYLTIFIIIVGLLAVFNIKRESRPNVDFHLITISIDLIGASPHDVAELILVPIEEKLDELDGIKEYKSTAFQGVAQITIKLDADYSKKDEMLYEVRNAIEQIKNFPPLAKKAVINRIDSSKVPILELALTYDLQKRSFIKIKQLAEKIEGDLKSITGISAIKLAGNNDMQFAIHLNPQQINAHAISLSEIAHIINKQNIETSLGDLYIDNQTYKIHLNEKLTNVKQIENLIIRKNDAGNILRIKDIAQVTFVPEKAKVKKLYNGEDAIIFTIYKNESYDIIKIIDQIKAYLANNEEYHQANNIKINTLYDDSKYIRSKLSIMSLNLTLGAIMVILLLFITINFSIAFITIIGIVVALFATINILWFYGLSLNSLTILGAIIVLGMLVDDAMVIAENIFSHMEKRVSTIKATIMGVTEIAPSVISSVLTTIIAFIPLLFMKGIIGQFLMVIPLVVTVALSFSLLEALFIMPVHALFLLKKPQKEKKDFFIKISAIYRKYLLFMINHKNYIFLGAIIYIIITIISAKNFLHFTLFPSTGVENINIKIVATDNISTDHHQLLVAELNKKILNIAGKDIEGIKTTIGESTIDYLTSTIKKGSNFSLLEVNFITDNNFIKREKQVINNITHVVKEFAQHNNLPEADVEIVRGGPPVGHAVELLLYGENFEETIKSAHQLQNFMGGITGVTEYWLDLQKKTLQYKLIFDHAKINQLNLNMDHIKREISLLFDQDIISTSRIMDEDIAIVFKLPQQEQHIRNLLNIKILTQKMQYIPLSAFTKLELINSRNAIYKNNGKKSITVFANIDENIITSYEINSLIKSYLHNNKTEFSNVTININGEEQERIDAVTDTMKLYILAMIGIFMIISIHFNSIWLPFIILLVIPFSFTGAIWALLLHNMPLSMMSIIGLVGLSGVAVNGAIILLKLIDNNLNKLDPKTQDISVIENIVITVAVRRLRPVLLTSITTLVCLIPTIYGLGGTDIFIKPMVLVLGWGLLFSTIFIILIFPAILITALSFSRHRSPTNTK